MVDEMKAIAMGEGDLTKRLPATTGDEIGELVKWFNQIIEKLQGLVTQLAGSSNRLVNENVSEGSTTCTEIFRKIEGVNAAAAEVSSESVGVSHNGSELKRVTGQLFKLVGNFRI